jgi:hypothetical protein
MDVTKTMTADELETFAGSVSTYQYRFTGELTDFTFLVGRPG